MSIERAISSARHALGHNDPAAALAALKPRFREIERHNEPATFTLLGSVFAQLGDPASASEWFAKAVQIDPGQSAAWRGMAAAFASAGHHAPAANAMAHALSNCGEPPASMVLEAAIYSRLAGHLENAATLLETHGPFHTREEDIRLGNLSECLLEQGRLDDLAALESKCAQSLGSARHFNTNLVRAALYRPEETAESLRHRAEQWARIFAPTPPEPAPWPTHAGAAIRVGFLNSCCHAHNTAQHLLGLLPHVDRTMWHVTLIHTGHRSDAITQRLQNLADGWIHIDPQAADPLAAIRKAGLHVLIEMNEFANGGMHWLLARQPAPLMFHWYGNAITTGLRHLDGRFTDAFAEPPAIALEGSSEPTLPLAGGYYAYQPFDFHQPASLEAPHEKNGHVTLGAIHHLAKFSTPYLHCLREILTRCPTTRFQVWRSALADEPTRRRFAARLQAHGLPMNRISLHHDNEEIATLRCFARFDLIPDAFPFTGDATNLDALASATPYVTLEGGHLCARRGAAMLRHIDLPEGIAATPEAYVNQCVRLIESPQRLRELRSEIHREFFRSPLCDGQRLAREMFTAILSIMKEKCPDVTAPGT